MDRWTDDKMAGTLIKLKTEGKMDKQTVGQNNK